MKAKDKILSFADAVVQSAKNNLGATRTVKGRKRRAISSRTLVDSLYHSTKITENKWGIKKVSMLFLAKSPADKYADVVEDGRRANSTPPPTSAILKWMEMKPIKLRDKKGSFIKKTPSRMRSAAYLISKSIGEKGIEGIKYYEEAILMHLEEQENSMMDSLAEEIIVGIAPNVRTK